MKRKNNPPSEELSTSNSNTATSLQECLKKVSNDALEETVLDQESSEDKTETADTSAQPKVTATNNGSTTTKITSNDDCTIENDTAEVGDETD